MGMPVLLSDIAEHRFLVDGFGDDFLFTLDSTSALAEKIARITDGYQEFTVVMERARERFSSNVFMEDWRNMLDGLKQ